MSRWLLRRPIFSCCHYHYAFDFTGARFSPCRSITTLRRRDETQRTVTLEGAHARAASRMRATLLLMLLLRVVIVAADVAFSYTCKYTRLMMLISPPLPCHITDAATIFYVAHLFIAAYAAIFIAPFDYAMPDTLMERQRAPVDCHASAATP